MADKNYLWRYNDYKKEAEKKCFETILKLWKHRSHYKNGQRPYENFESIFHTLERLDPENKQPYYYPEIQEHKAKSKGKSNVTMEVQKWLDIASAIDQAARVWIESVFNQAANSATDERTKEFIRNALALDDNVEIKVIVKLFGEESIDNGEISQEAEKQKKREKIRSRMKQLEDFNKYNKELLKIYESELESIC